MKNVVKLAPIAFLLGSAGCFNWELIYSLYPLYTDQDVVFEPALLGEWVSEDDSTETMTFEKQGENKYKLRYIDQDSVEGELAVQLLRLNGALFMDISLGESDLKLSSLHIFVLLPVHNFFLISQLDSTLQLSSLEFGWLKELLEKEPEAIRHEKVDSSIVLTAAPKELQKFLLKHLKTEGAFDEGGKFRRNKRAQE